MLLDKKPLIHIQFVELNFLSDVMTHQTNTIKELQNKVIELAAKTA